MARRRVLESSDVAVEDLAAMIRLRGGLIPRRFLRPCGKKNKMTGVRWGVVRRCGGKLDAHGFLAAMSDRSQVVAIGIFVAVRHIFDKDEERADRMVSK